MIDLAIIPARAGSVGLPGKNILQLGDQPLIAWTIRAARASEVFQRVVVSTDDKEIADAARAAGAEVPFIRPATLADASATTADVVRHAVAEIGPAACFALLQPTSPFRSGRHIQEAADRFEAAEVSSLIAVVRNKPVHWNYYLSTDDRIVPVLESPVNAHRRQDSRPVYVPNGAIYICRHAPFDRVRSLYHHDTIGFEMGLIDSIDIDGPDDFDLARAVVAEGLREIDP